MFERGDHVLIALSGGADSTALCSVLAELAPSLDLTLSAAYINHGLRPAENEGEKAFCGALCENLGITFFVEEAPAAAAGEGKEKNLQARARRLRYDVLEHRRREIGADRIAVAHTLDDQAETVLMRFVRGSGSRGLSGIPVRRGRIVRPLLGVRRSEVEAYLRARGQVWCEDSSNRSSQYRRNRLRLDLIARLSDENPSIVETLARMARLFGEEDAYLSEEARRLLKDVVATASETAVELDGKNFDEVPFVLRRRIVRMVAEDLGGGYGAGVLHTDRVMHTLSAGGLAAFPNGVTAERSGALIRFSASDSDGLGAAFQLTLEVPGTVATPDGSGLSSSIVPFAGDYSDGKTAAVFDPARVALPLTVRNRRPGDRMRPLGLSGWKKVQDILVDAKIPRFRRDGVPVVTAASGEILWVVGLVVDGRFSIDGQPGHVLRLTFERSTISDQEG